MGYDAARLRISDAKVTPRLQLIKVHVEVPLVDSRKPREIARGITRRGGWPWFPRDRARKGQRLSSVAATPILCPSRHEEKEVIVPRRNEASH